MRRGLAEDHGAGRRASARRRRRPRPACRRRPPSRSACAAPRTWMTSLTETGMPCSGPRRWPARSSPSRARASCRARLGGDLDERGPLVAGDPLQRLLDERDGGRRAGVERAPPRSAIAPWRGSPPSAGSGDGGGPRPRRPAGARAGRRSAALERGGEGLGGDAFTAAPPRTSAPAARRRAARRRRRCARCARASAPRRRRCGRRGSRRGSPGAPRSSPRSGPAS